MRNVFFLLLPQLLPQLLSQVASMESPLDDSVPQSYSQEQMRQVKDVSKFYNVSKPPSQVICIPSQVTPPSRVAPPSELVSQECLKENHTHLSCGKMFCEPWKRCISGRCVCKLPYQCPRLAVPVCGMDGRRYLSLCQAQAIACRSSKAIFSHFGSTCEDTFKVHLMKSGNSEVILMEAGPLAGRALVCGDDWWDIAAANVVCRHKKNEARGASAAQRLKLREVYPQRKLQQCVRVSCTGSELSLAECTLSKPKSIRGDTEVAAVQCYHGTPGEEACPEFHCVNGKCVSWEHVCNGIDDCADRSDELCCKDCRGEAFLCKNGACLHPHAVRDTIRDCLGGEDELPSSSTEMRSRQNITILDSPEESEKEAVLSQLKDDILAVRNITESQLHCGIPNMDYVYKSEEETRRTRHRRVVGGQEALPTQIQWQVAVVEDGGIHCGGAYLGGCWVLTAAHCVRPNPKAFNIKFSIWNKLSLLNTTDLVPVKNIIIHQAYNPTTYQNDIALVQLEKLNLVTECLNPNPAVRAVCVPWTTLQFLPGTTCSISGWGRNRVGMSTDILKWANVTLIGDCRKYYSDRFYEGMECAGDLEGKVDSCQGDSGGPLVCTDASGTSYVWGVVSWGEKCGEVGFPGVYTKVAHYFEWIRFHTGWPAVTKYNQ